MAVEKRDEVDWARITVTRARVLAELENQQTERHIAESLSVAMTTIRTHVEDLKSITGCGDVREIGRWWRMNRSFWLRWCAEQGRVPRGEWDAA